MKILLFSILKVMVKRCVSTKNQLHKDLTYERYVEKLD